MDGAGNSESEWSDPGPERVTSCIVSYMDASFEPLDICVLKLGVHIELRKPVRDSR